MKNLALNITLVISALFGACDVQSGITKKSVEKYEASPTPAWKVVTEEPIDPADAIAVDTAVEGPQISVSKPDEANKPAKCDKYNRVMINGDGKKVRITGVCSQIMINGNRNKVTAVAAAEITVNGRENSVEYSKYANGKRPQVKDNGDGNTILKVELPKAK